MSKRKNENDEFPSVTKLAEQMVEDAKNGGVALTGEGGLLTQLTKKVLQTAFETEMEEHLGYEHGDRLSKSISKMQNSRNGATPKTIKTELGDIDVEVPRDRNGSFEPTIVPKHKRRIDGFNDQVLALYAGGMTTQNIVEYLKGIYGNEVSKQLVSNVTDSILEDMKEWQARPLERVYPVLFFDAIVMKVRGGTVSNRPIYVAYAIDMNGDRDILGMWIGPPGGEGAKQWMNMFSELKNRGVEDILIACCDGLKGLPEALRDIWPEVTVQTCVVHMIRNSLKFVPYKDMKQVASDLKKIYAAPSVEAAETEFQKFSDQYEKKYPYIIKSWKSKWLEFIPFLDFPPEIRKIIYTTNSIESLNSRFRAAARRRGHFPTEQSAMKLLYLSVVRKDAKNGTQRKVFNWKQVLNILYTMYGERLEK